jgi:hypothetical protein
MALDINIASTGGTATTPAVGVPVDVKDGAVRIFSENDDGTLIAGHAPYLKSPETSPDYRIRTGRDTILFSDSFNATAQNTDVWNYVFVTLTAAQAGVGSVNFGAVQGTAATHGAYMRTSQYFPLIGTSALSAEFTVGMFTAALVTDEVWLMGMGLPQTAILRPLDGVWLKITTAGVEGIICFNNTETSTGIIYPFESLKLGDVDKFVIVIGEQEVEYWVNDQLMAEQLIPTANGQPFLGKTVPLFMQKYCSGAVSNTNTMRVMDVTCTLYDIDYLMPRAHVAALAGSHISKGQNGQTQGLTAGNYLNAATPTTAAGSNTALTANLPAGVGGYGVMTAQAGAVTASHDMIATSYLNPVPTINITGRNMVITGVWISCMNTGATVATTPTSLIWGLAYGHVGVSLPLRPPEAHAKYPSG